MCASISLLLALSVFAACSAKPLMGSKFICAYSTDFEVHGKDINRCFKSCEGYSDVAYLKKPLGYERIYLFCYEDRFRKIVPQESPIIKSHWMVA